MFKSQFSDYLYRTNVEGSGKASSYIRAMDRLIDMLNADPASFSDCQDLWSVSSLERIQALYKFTTIERSKKDKSIWNIEGISKSYLQNGYCSSALKAYLTFLIENQHEAKLLAIFHAHTGDESELALQLPVEIGDTKFLQSDISSLEGKDLVRRVRTRSNQHVFRKMIMHIYNNTCCITGLDIPDINRASHIIPWATDKKKRLDPRNGLCLSATYDAAFDRNLISLDDDYRVLVSRDLKDHYSTQSVKEYFLKKEGHKIIFPNAYKPELEYLEKHRKSGNF